MGHMRLMYFIAICCALMASGCLGDASVDDDPSAYSTSVVEGSIEPDAQFPWVLSLNGCRGVLIDPGWLLTAAHCVAHGWSQRIEYTRTDPYTEHQESRERIIPSTGHVFIHPEYAPVGGVDAPRNDIALVRLPVPFGIDRYLQIVALPDAPLEPGDTGIVAAGRHAAIPGEVPPGYYAVYRGTVPPAPPAGCVGHQVCVRAADASLCPGDSGSGFITFEGGRATVAGIASVARTADSDCRTSSPDDYVGLVDVHAYRDWILATIGMDAGALAGNTRVRWSDSPAHGVMTIQCPNPHEVLEGPLDVYGVEPRASCSPGHPQTITCQLTHFRGEQEPTPRPYQVNGIRVKNTDRYGLSVFTILPYSSTHASYTAIMPPDTVRDFTCLVGPSVVSAPTF